MKVLRMSEAALMQAHEQEDWQALWLQAIPLAKFALRKLSKTKGSKALDEDTFQDTLLALGGAVRRWEPSRGKFSTFIFSWARGAALKSMAAAWQQTEESEESIDAAYDPAPEGLGDPALQEETEELRTEYAEYLLAHIEADEDRGMLRKLYGVGAAKLSQREYAQEKGLSERTVRRRVKNLLSQLSGIDRQTA